MCKASQPNCGPPAGEYCIFHKPEKTPEEEAKFVEEFAKRYGQGIYDKPLDCRGYVFPKNFTLFKNATFKKEANFDGAVLTSATFENAVFEKEVSFRKATIKDTTFKKATFKQQADFQEAEIENTDFTEATFHKKATFEKAHIKKCNFTKTVFHGAARFFTAKIEDTNLDIQFTNVDFMKLR